MITCKEACERASENIDTPLQGIKWLKTKYHLLICAYCRRYNQQIKLASETVNQLEPSEQPNKDVHRTVEDCYKDLHCNKSHP